VKLIIATALLLMLSTAAIAAADTATTGPYTVSFNLNTNMNYVKEEGPAYPTEIATQYPLLIKTNNDTYSMIYITEYNNFTDSTPMVHKVLNRLNLIFEGYTNSTVADRTIDGKEGFVIMALKTPQATQGGDVLYQAVYWTDSKNCDCGPVTVGMTNVIVRSFYPQDVTDSLLSSIHVEKTGTAATTATGQQMGQATTGQATAGQQAGQVTTSMTQQSQDMPPADNSGQASSQISSPQQAPVQTQMPSTPAPIKLGGMQYTPQ